MKKIILLGIATMLYISCSSSPKAKQDNKIKTPKTSVAKGDRVSAYYKGSYPDGTIFDERWDHSSPMAFTAGVGMMIPGFDDAVIGMKVGEEKTIVIKPADAYGEFKKDLLKKVKRDKLRKGYKPTLGDRIRYPNTQGSYNTFPVVEIKDSHITLDLNHPMAGKTLIFTIKIDKIE